MDSAKIHSLLRRQLKRTFGDAFEIPAQWQGFIELINDAYNEFDTDRNMLERSLELSSQELLQANSEMRAIFEAIPDLFFRLNHEGLIIDCKAGNTSDLYISRERLIGNRIYEIPIESIASIFKNALGQIKETRSSVNMEYSIALDGGGTNYYEARLMPVPGDQIIAIIRNVTERKLAEMALFESETKYRSIVEESPFGVFIVQDKFFKFVNKRFCEIYGYEYNEIVDKFGPKDFILPEDLPSIKNEIKKIKEIGETARFDFRIQNRYGEIKSIKATGSYIAYKGVLSFIGTILDMSKEKVLEEQLLQSQKLETIGRLTGGIAHDFNNMLGVILGNTQLAKLHCSPEDKIYEFFSTIEKATSRAADFVRQLLAFSSRQVLELRTVDLEETLGSFTKMIRRMIGEHIEMTMAISTGLPKIKADVTQINQVLLNLVVNARDAMSEGGRLTIEAYAAKINKGYSSFYTDLEPGNYVVLSVTDTGCGIPKNMLNNIYEPFFTTKKSGTGLGLSVVYGIVKQHNGFINVYSEPGKGTTFKVYIPSAGEYAIEGDDIPEISIEGGDETILIVEDDADMRNIVSEILKALGYNIIIASDGEEGLNLFKDNYSEIDFVILDVVMPKLSGREAYEEIKKIKPDTALLFVTGYSLNTIHTDFILKEGIEVLQKPYSFEEIAMKIRRILDKRNVL